MARPRTFDEDKALARAMELFWTQGYEQASMDDLVRTTGVHRGTLYSLYGDKRGLLLASLDRYLEHVVRPITADLRSNPDGWAAIKTFFSELANGISHERLPRCCLTLHCAIEAQITDSEVATRVHAMLRLVDDSFESALRRAQLRGDVPQDMDAKVLASMMRCMLQGLQLFARATPRHEDILRIPEMLLSLVAA